MDHLERFFGDYQGWGSLRMRDYRVLILTQGIDGGIARMSSFLSSALHEIGMCVFNVYIGRPGNNEYEKLDRKNGILSQSIVTGKARTYKELSGLVFSIFKVNRLIHKFKPDFIIYNGQIPLINYFFLRGKFKRIFYDHGPQFSFKVIKNLLNRVAFSRIDHVMSVAKFSGAILLKNYHQVETVRHVANCVLSEKDLVLKEYFTFSGKLRILMAARLDLIQKDPITLIKAVNLAKQAGVKIELDLAGDGPALNTVKKFIKRNNCEDYIKCLGHVSCLNRHLYKYNISCLSTNYESFGLSLVEGMAAGHLAIGSKVCGVTDVINDGRNGLLFEKGDFESLAELFVMIYTRPKDFNSFISRATRDVQKFYTFERYRIRVKELFTEKYV